MITLVSVWSDLYVPLADITVRQNREIYCQARGYKFAHKRYEAMHPHSAGYDRMEWLLELMNQAEEDDWFWCLGVDAMIMNFSVPVERFIEGEHHMVITRDVNVECLNGDSYMVKASKEGKSIIQKLVSERHRWPNGAAECWALAEMVQDHPWRDYIKEVPQREINAYDYSLYGPNLGAPPGAQPRDEIERRAADGNYQDGDFVIHWPGQGLEVRLRLAQEYLQKVRAV